jgi:hypothetical protein
MDNLGGRRQFFRLLAREAIVATQEVRGVRHIRLDRFADVPDSKVGQLIPIIQPGLRISIDGDDVIATLPSGERQRLFGSAEPDAVIFRSFNGCDPISKITSDMCQNFGLTPERSISAVRMLFLRLANLGIASTCNCWQD